MRFSLLYSGEQVLSCQSCLFFRAGTLEFYQENDQNIHAAQALAKFYTIGLAVADFSKLHSIIVRPKESRPTKKLNVDFQNVPYNHSVRPRTVCEDLLVDIGIVRCKLSSYYQEWKWEKSVCPDLWTVQTCRRVQAEFCLLSCRVGVEYEGKGTSWTVNTPEKQSTCTPSVYYRKSIWPDSANQLACTNKHAADRVTKFNVSLYFYFNFGSKSENVIFCGNEYR